jgi:hypothetical protein
MMGTEAFKNEIKGKACGLQIFNTSTLCVETWNGTKWIEQCMDCEDITFPALDKYYNFCDDATVADLADKIGADIYEYPSGGSKRSPTTVLDANVTYYAEQQVANCTAPARTAVKVNLGNCTLTPTGAKLTTFVNVMYDFQHQTIEAYNTGGGIGTDYDWSVSTSGYADSFTSVPDAPNSPFFTVPANFSDRYNSGDYKCDTLWFKCKISNNSGVSATTADSILNIIFIKTTSAGYGIDANGVRYLTLERGVGGSVQGGKIKVALLNLGQSANWTLDNGYTPNNNAADLGDYYQWGRVADGHQNVAWSKKANYENTTEPMTGGENTSVYTDYIGNDNGVQALPAYDPVTHQIKKDNYHYGKLTFSGRNYAFEPLNGDYDWYFECTDPSNRQYCYHNDGLWGTSQGTDRAAQGSLGFWWDIPANNPCPPGWRIPSIWNWWDFVSGDGSNDPTGVNWGSAANNNWQHRDMSSPNSTDDWGALVSTFGGAIITNSDNEKIFLPMLAYRTGFVVHTGVDYRYGSYLSSTRGEYGSCGINCPVPRASALSFDKNGISTNTLYNRDYAYCARCVKE